MMQVHVRWKLRQFLSSRGLTAYKLAKALPESRQPTIYRLASDKAPGSVSFAVLGQVLQGLGRLTGETVHLDDVLEVTEDAVAVQNEQGDDSGLTFPLKKFAPRPAMSPLRTEPNTLEILNALRGKDD